MTLRLPLVTVCLAVVLLGCAKNTSSGDLARLAHGYCFDLEENIARAAARHRQLAPAIDEKRLSAEQLERANDDLAMSSIGNTAESRRARLLDFESHFQFCKAIHVMDDAQEKQFATRWQTLREQLGQSIGTGEMPSAAATADLLDQLHTVVHELDALPMKR